MVSVLIFELSCMTLKSIHKSHYDTASQKGQWGISCDIIGLAKQYNLLYNYYVPGALLGSRKQNTSRMLSYRLTDGDKQEN